MIARLRQLTLCGGQAGLRRPQGIHVRSAVRAAPAPGRPATRSPTLTALSIIRPEIRNARVTSSSASMRPVRTKGRPVARLSTVTVRTGLGSSNHLVRLFPPARCKQDGCHQRGGREGKESRSRPPSAQVRSQTLRGVPSAVVGAVTLPRRLGFHIRPNPDQIGRNVLRHSSEAMRLAISLTKISRNASVRAPACVTASWTGNLLLAEGGQHSSRTTRRGRSVVRAHSRKPLQEDLRKASVERR